MIRTTTNNGVLMLWLVLLLALPAASADTPPAAGPPPAIDQAPAGKIPAPMTDIHDIRPPVAVGLDAPWLTSSLLALTAVLILAVLWWWWRKHRKKQTIETIVPELPPETVAMQALDKISDVRRLEGKAFYFKLSAILRHYIFGRFTVGAPEMTTEEFVPCIDRLPVDKKLAHQLKQLCRAMDPIKFGVMTTMEKQMETDLFFARAFVRQTTPTSATGHHTDNGDAADTVVRREA